MLPSVVMSTPAQPRYPIGRMSVIEANQTIAGLVCARGSSPMGKDGGWALRSFTGKRLRAKKSSLGALTGLAIKRSQHSRELRDDGELWTGFFEWQCGHLLDRSRQVLYEGTGFVARNGFVRRYPPPPTVNILSEIAHTALCGIHIVGVGCTSSRKKCCFFGSHSLTASGLRLAI
jgi:hypothetical protein